MSEKLRKDERETIVLYNEEDNNWVIDTSVQKHIRKFDKLGYKCVNEQLYPDGTICSKQYAIPVYSVSFRSPIKRKMTDEQKEKARERFLKTRKED